MPEEAPVTTAIEPDSFLPERDGLPRPALSGSDNLPTAPP
jgi:hypothetical protein